MIGYDWTLYDRIGVVEQRTDLTSTWQQPGTYHSLINPPYSKLLCAGNKWLVGFLGVLYHLFSVSPSRTKA